MDEQSPQAPNGQELTGPPSQPSDQGNEITPNDRPAADHEPETGSTETSRDEVAAAPSEDAGQPSDVIAPGDQAPALEPLQLPKEELPAEDEEHSGEGLPAEEKKASEGKQAAKASEDDTAKRDLEQQVKQKIGEKHVDKEVLPLYEVPKDVLGKYESIFIPSTHYQDVFTVGKNSEKRVFLVHGDDPEWNFICGTNLGTALIKDRHGSQQPVVMVYRRDALDTRTLIDFVRQRGATDSEPLKPSYTVYVIEDAFQRGIRSEDLNDVSLGQLNTELMRLYSYLVLTIPSLRVDSIPGLEILATQVETGVLFDKLLTYYQKGGAADYIADRVLQLARDARDDLLPELKNYTLVKRFFSAIVSLSVTCTPGEVIEKAKEVAQAGERESGDRFRSLSPNAKLYALLAVLFDDVEKRTVDEIYIAAVQELRKQGINNLRDARQFGLSDMLEYIQADLSTDGRIEFRSQRFKEHICRKQLANHHHLLWSLIEMLCDLVEQYREESFAGFRESLGSVIGQLGIGYESKFFDLVEKLAQQKDGRVASVSAYALEEFCRRHPEKFEPAAELITQWAESLDPDLMWASGVAIGRVYRVVAPETSSTTASTQRLQDILTNLAASVDRPEQIQQWVERSDDFHELHTQLPPELHDLLVVLVVQSLVEVVASSVAQAIHWIATNHATDAVALITRWLEADPGTRMHELGLRMAVQLFHENSSEELILIDKVHIPLLGLIGPLLQAAVRARSAGAPDTVTETRSALNAAIQTLETWPTKNAESDWGSHVHAALLRVVNRATLDGRRILQSALTAHFLTSENERVRHIGQALNARCAAMDGQPIDMPGRRYGVIALDASYQRRLLPPLTEAGRNLYLHLDGRVDMHLVTMGNAHVAIGPAQIPLLADLRSQGDFPRLLAAVLGRNSAPNPAEAHFVLALSGGPILDAEDLDDSAWQSKLIVAGPNPSAKWRDDLSFVAISRYPDDGDLRRIENRVSQHLGQRLAALAPDEWWPTLTPYLCYAPTDLDGICSQLSTWAANLDHVEESKHPGDVTHTIACTVLWLAKAELARCLALLKEWLHAQDETRRIMGLACTKLLFNVYGEQTPPARFETLGPIMGIVPELIQTKDWGAILAVLQAIHIWLTDLTWASHILASGSTDTDRADNPSADLLAALADHTPAANRNDLKQILGTWRAEKDAPDALRQATDRLLIRLLLGEGSKLPDLPTGQQYGLILLDASRTRGSLARVAAQLAKELRANPNAKDKFYPVIWRLGQKIPVAVKGQTPSVEELVPAGLHALPRLAGPALDTLIPQQVGFIVLLCNGAILDEEDWHKRWKDVPAFAYGSPFGKMDWASSFRVVPGQRSEQDAATEIIRFIFNALKG
jgi:hypothetical protein